MRKITAVQRIGTYCRVSDGSQVDMRHGILIEQRNGKQGRFPIFFFMRKLREVIVSRDELCRDWYPKYGSHVCGDQYNKKPDMLAQFGDRQDTTWEKWKSQ